MRVCVCVCSVKFRKLVRNIELRQRENGGNEQGEIMAMFFFLISDFLTLNIKLMLCESILVKSHCLISYYIIKYIFSILHHRRTVGKNG